MKIKPTKTCRRKGCNKVFKLYKTTDKYCSPSCAYEDQKNRPKKNRIFFKPIPKETEKRKRESYLYSKKKKIFMSLPENQLCPVALAIFKQEIQTCELHHKAGRRGKFLNYVPLWLAVSEEGHKWIHANPKEAYKRGFLIKNTTVNI